LTRGDEGRVADILEASAKLAPRLDTAFELWLADEDLRLVTERLLEVIGEAARAMTDEGRSGYPDVDWAGFIGLRNVLVHAYHRVQPDLLWQAETVDVPALARSLRQSD